MILRNKWLVVIISLIIAIVIIAITSFILSLSQNSMLSDLLLGTGEGSKRVAYPFTIQNLLYLLFAWGAGELFVRWQTSLRETALLSKKLLPEADEALRDENLGDYRRNLNQYRGNHNVLPNLIDRSILQFRTQGSVDQVVSVLDSTLDLQAAKLETDYNIPNYIVWAIPTIGFIGTIIGISGALFEIQVLSDVISSSSGTELVSAPNENSTSPNTGINAITGKLAIAFNTTLIALILSAILNFILHIVRNHEQRGLVNMGDYVLRNLVNRLVERR